MRLKVGLGNSPVITSANQDMEESVMKAWKSSNMRYGLCSVMAFVGIGILLCISFGCGDDDGGDIPSGLSIESITGDTGPCFADYYSSLDLMGGAFTLALRVRNTSTESITYTLPAGTRFVPDSSAAQTMMLLQPYTITIMPGESKVLCLPVYCLDAELDAPEEGYSYILGDPVTRSCLQEIIELTEGKTIGLADAMKLQVILWNCIEDGSLSSEDRSYLRNL